MLLYQIKRVANIESPRERNDPRTALLSAAEGMRDGVFSYSYKEPVTALLGFMV